MVVCGKPARSREAHATNGQRQVKKKKWNYTPERLEIAVELVRSGAMSERGASTCCGVPNATIRHQLDGDRPKTLRSDRLAHSCPSIDASASWKDAVALFRTRTLATATRTPLRAVRRRSRSGRRLRRVLARCAFKSVDAALAATKCATATDYCARTTIGRLICFDHVPVGGRRTASAADTARRVAFRLFSVRLCSFFRSKLQFSCWRRRVSRPH
jgi:hypothetical protein